MAEVKKYSEIRKEFYEKYQKKIVPVVKQYDGERKVKLLFAIILATIFIILGLLVGYSAFISQGSKAQESGLKGAVILFGLAWGSWWSIKKGFENKIKKMIMPTVCACFGNMKWSEGSYSNGKVFSESCVIPNFTSESYDDIFQGSYKDVGIEIVESEFEIGSGKSRRTVFKGAIVKLDMNKNFNSHTVIKHSGLLHVSPTKELIRTTLEDVNFNKKYDVFTNDEVDARYLLTTTFMERLMKMKTAFQANKVSCAFYKEHLIIALSTNKDLFSIGSLVKPVDDPKQFFNMYEEIISIIKLINLFKLDQKIGM